ncbi:MAG: hypothetical protein RL172_1934 [Bacteroidota bacterium]|jgi:phosphoribosylamine---glycine ligase
MNILIAGSGGREHALAWKILQSKQCTQLFVAPGNAGTGQIATNVNIKATDFEALAAFCLSNQVQILMVGPEEPLVKGIYDYFTSNPATAHIHIIGPSQAAAQLEGSKAFAKQFMYRHQIPTAAYMEFDADNYAAGADYIRNHPLPIVLKADGLAAGKGVLICNNHIEALAEYELMLQQAKFGDAGKKVVIEAFLTGIELSVFVFTDGLHYVLLPEAKDYKRIGEGDTGLNTGGMGAVSPVPFADEAFMQKVITRVIEPTVKGLQQESLTYKGVVFFGLIKVGDDPFVIEYNCRFGDPETEVVIPRIENDLVEILLATSQQRLNEITITTKPQPAVTVMAVSGGYPNEYNTGFPILGLREQPLEGTHVFHAGTQTNQSGQVVTNGGRVLTVTAFSETISEATEKAIVQLESLYFDGMYYRSDIGYEFI